jgi:basic amino acid/polyamine antiporter, APA family
LSDPFDPSASQPARDPSGRNPGESGQNPAASPPRDSNVRLLRVLGVWFGIAAALGNTIAAGIVRAPGNIAHYLPHPILYLAVWVVGGLYALCGASSLAELGAAIPRSGGQYNYSRRALGDYAGFVVGWSDWLSACGALAVVAIVIGEYTCKLFSLPEVMEKSVAVSSIAAFAILQWRGIKTGSAAQLITAALKSIAFIVLALACFVVGPSAGGAVSAGVVNPPPLPSGFELVVAFMLGLQAVIYTIDGWNGVLYFSEELKNPGRDVPRAIFGSVFSIMAIYLLVNAAMLYLLPMSEIVGNKFCLGTVAQKIFGVYGDPVIRTIMIISLLSCLNALQLFVSRVLYIMSCDGLFIRSASRVNKGGTPAFALALSVMVGVTFVLRSFERVIAMLSFLFVVNYMLSYISLFVLRFKAPDMPRPYRAWGYPWTAGIALIGSVAFLVGSISTDRENAPLALAMLAVSYPVFRLLQMFRRLPARLNIGQ